MRTAVGLLVEPDDVDDPQRVDLAGDQVRRRADQRRVRVGDLAAAFYESALAELGDERLAERVAKELTLGALRRSKADQLG